MKTIIYYTCNTHLPKIDDLGRFYLRKIELPIVSVSLNKEIDFGDIKIVFESKRSPLTMHKQIVMGLKSAKTKYVFLAESDVLYHPSHFDFIPTEDNVFYFNTNVWKLRWNDGLCAWTDDLQQLSGMSGNKEFFLDFFEKRTKEIKRDGFNRHYEPPNSLRKNYKSKLPNLCIRHNANLTQSKWSVDDFRNKKYAKGWKTTSLKNIPYWGKEKIL